MQNNKVDYTEKTTEFANMGREAMERIIEELEKK